MITKGILHHLTKFQISWPCFTVILGNLKKLEQGMIIFGTRREFLEQDENYLGQVENREN